MAHEKDPPTRGETVSPPHDPPADLRAELSRVAPFAQMTLPDVDFFLAHATPGHFAPDEILIGPQHQAVDGIYFIRQGAVTGEQGVAGDADGAFQYEAGDLFPVSAALAGRAVTATYRATADTAVLALPRAAMLELAGVSGVFADFLHHRIQQLLQLSRQALQTTYSSQALAEQSLEKPLSEVARRVPVTCAAQTPLRDALTTMLQQRIGSILVVDAQGAPVGILTRYDILGRVTLPGVSLDTPIAQVMVQPVLALTDQHTAQDAALLMSRHGIRHVPVTRSGRAVGIVSERDLFAMQRLSLRQVSTSLRAANDVESLAALAPQIRRFAHTLLAQGVHARQLTALISHLNDVLTERLLLILSIRHGIDLHQVCWLALGSEGRSEQTIATDQDNALILRDDISARDRAAMLTFARAVNDALDACGYPLCQGGVMAGNEACCLTMGQWRSRFMHWIEQGAPQDLLNANIYFDFRSLAGDAAMAQALRAEVTQHAQRVPRFLKQLAANALRQSVPLNWLGNIALDGAGMVDLKLQGAALFVDAARLFALAQGVTATGTRDRLVAAGPSMGVSATEYEAWAVGFEFIQMLRLQVQLQTTGDIERPNHVAVASLNDIDRRMLKESFRVGRAMQQRLQLDYMR